MSFMAVNVSGPARYHRRDGSGGLEIVVVGGGIGGLAATVSLRAAGWPVRVLERSARFGEIGAGIQLAPNATRILDTLGVLDRIRPVAVFPRRLVLNDALTGTELTALDLTDRHQRDGGPYLVLHRSDLLDALVRTGVCRARRGAGERGRRAAPGSSATTNRSAPATWPIAGRYP
jgi:choline dehydrogenase-like flavoprotein